MEAKIGTAIDDRFATSTYEHLERALELGADDGWDFRFEDIARIESLWRLDDADAVSCGFVALLNGGRRVYFDYTLCYDDDIDEHFGILPMASERYPAIGETGAGWDDAPIELNRHFAH